MNETVMKDAFATLTEEQIEFVCKELDIEADALKKKSEDELNEIYEALCDVEVDEICKAGEKKVSERGEMATSIVTIVGNYFAEKLGYADEEEFERFLTEDDE